MTQRYAHLSPAYRRSMVDRMEQIWARPAGESIRPNAVKSHSPNNRRQDSIKRAAVAISA